MNNGTYSHQRLAISYGDIPSPMTDAAPRAACPNMTKDKFRELCEQVLIPRLGDFMHVQLTDLNETLDAVARELVRVGDRLDRVIAHLTKRDDHVDHR
jgi:hypothetical protein